jgi:hypothetical protein
MAVHIGEVTTDVTALGEELPLSPAQLDRLVELVAARMQDRTRRLGELDRERTLRRGVTPPTGIEES